MSCMSISHIGIVEQCVRELIQKFEKNSNFFTSESDVKCWLYHLLVSKEPFQRSFLTKDRKYTGLVHSEYPSVLRFNVDLVIFDPENIGDYRLKRQRVLCQIEIKFWRSTAYFHVEDEKKLRDRLGEDKQAHKFIIYLYPRNDLSYWQGFKKDLLRHKEENEEMFLDSTVTTALVTRIRPENT